MSAPTQAPELDSRELLAALARHNVEFLVVGGLGCQLHGATRMTHDLDVCPAWGQENFERLAAALDELGTLLRLRPELGDVEVRPNANLLREVAVTHWRTRAGYVDVLIAIPAGERGQHLGFRQLSARAITIRASDAESFSSSLCRSRSRSGEGSNSFKRPPKTQGSP